MSELGREVAALVEQLHERRLEYNQLKQREEHLSLASDRKLGEKVSHLCAEIARLETDIQALINKAGGMP